MMFPQSVASWLLIGGSAAAIGVWLLSPVWRRWRRAVKQSQTVRALDLFRRQREILEAKFFEIARALGKPRGLSWLDCEWCGDVTFARACDTGLLTAFVGVNIRFQAIEGGDMEGIEHVDAIRDAAAVFHFQNGRWGTGGKALFNMNPQEAIKRLAGQFDPVITGP